MTFTSTVKKKATLTRMEQGYWANCQVVGCRCLAQWKVCTLKTGHLAHGSMVRIQLICEEHIQKFYIYHEIVEELVVPPVVVEVSAPVPTTTALPYPRTVTIANVTGFELDEKGNVEFVSKPRKRGRPVGYRKPKPAVGES